MNNEKTKKQKKKKRKERKKKGREKQGGKEKIFPIQRGPLTIHNSAVSTLYTMTKCFNRKEPISLP